MSTSITKQIFEEITCALKNDELVLPTLPEVALRVREAAQDPDIDINNLGEIIATDAALTARIIKVVNSPLLRSPNSISDLGMAISRLGLVYTSNLALGLAMEQMFQATNGTIDRLLRTVWARSTEVAGISHALCQFFTSLRPDQATLAGLVHQIGILPILTYAEERNEQLLENETLLMKIIEYLHPHLGQRILQAWDFAPELIAVPYEYRNFSRDSATVDYVDIVQVACLQSYAGTEHPLASTDWSRVPAFDKLGLDARTQLEENEQLSHSMAAATQLLS